MVALFQVVVALRKMKQYKLIHFACGFLNRLAMRLEAVLVGQLSSIEIDAVVDGRHAEKRVASVQG